MKFRYTLAALMIFGAVQAQNALALPGPAPDGDAIAQYDPATGEIVVSMTNVNNWFIRSASFSLTGDAPSHTPIVPGSLASDNDEIIGETGFSLGTGTDVSLGFVAAQSLDLSDLEIVYVGGLGTPEESALLTLLTGGGNTAPTAGINGPFTVNIFNGDPLNILLDASSSTDPEDDSLTYLWDLDNDGDFDDADTGTDPTFAIADVAAQFGGLGVFSVAVQVSDGEFTSTASTNVNLVPEPGSLALACLGLIGVVVTRRRRTC